MITVPGASGGGGEARGSKSCVRRGTGGACMQYYNAVVAAATGKRRVSFLGSRGRKEMMA